MFLKQVTSFAIPIRLVAGNMSKGKNFGSGTAICITRRPRTNYICTKAFRKILTPTLLLELIHAESVASNIFEIHVPSIITLRLFTATGNATELLDTLLSLLYC